MYAQAKFLNKIGKRSWPIFLKRGALAVLAVCLVASVADAGRMLHYKTYHPKTGEVSNRFSCLLEEMSSGGYRAHWTIEEDGETTQEDYVLNANLETMYFRVVNLRAKTDYMGQREGNIIRLRGRFKGDVVDSVIRIDERPFYYNPKLGLMGFAQSGKKVGKFWGFQNRELKAYPMKAINRGPDVISVGGRNMEVTEVAWTVDDFRSAFFKRTYWFRQSDGLYVKQKSGKGLFRELIKEEVQ